MLQGHSKLIPTSKAIPRTFTVFEPPWKTHALLFGWLWSKPWWRWPRWISSCCWPSAATWLTQASRCEKPPWRLWATLSLQAVAQLAHKAPWPKMVRFWCLSLVILMAWFWTCLKASKILRGECENFLENLDFACMAILSRLQSPQQPHGSHWLGCRNGVQDVRWSQKLLLCYLVSRQFFQRRMGRPKDCFFFHFFQVGRSIRITVTICYTILYVLL